MIHRHIHHRLRKHGISFKHAFEGIMWSIRTQPNYQVHLFLAFVALLGGYFYRISYTEFLIIILLVFVGLAIETINTAIEKTCDAVSLEYNEHLKVAKDVAAGAMLTFAFGAFVIAAVIFLPKMFA
jgi:diacylglycerol kinase